MIEEFLKSVCPPVGGMGVQGGSTGMLMQFGAEMITNICSQVPCILSGTQTDLQVVLAIIQACT